MSKRMMDFEPKYRAYFKGESTPELNEVVARLAYIDWMWATIYINQAEVNIRETEEMTAVGGDYTPQDAVQVKASQLDFRQARPLNEEDVVDDEGDNAVTDFLKARHLAKNRQIRA